MYHREAFHLHPVIKTPKVTYFICQLANRVDRKEITLPDQDYQQKGLPLHPNSSCLGMPTISRKKMINGRITQLVRPSYNWLIGKRKSGTNNK